MIGAQVNAVLLLGAAVWIAIEAVQRLGETPDIDGAGVAVVAALGLLVNTGSAWVVAARRRREPQPPRRVLAPHR